jgi:hypothetical protein
MKHIKHHPLNDKHQKLSKDMKKQDLVRPKKDKKLEPDDSLSDPTITKRVSKPSNKHLSSEKHLAKDSTIKKITENTMDPERMFHDEGEEACYTKQQMIEFANYCLDLGEVLADNVIDEWLAGGYIDTPKPGDEHFKREESEEGHGQHIATSREDWNKETGY